MLSKVGAVCIREVATLRAASEQTKSDSVAGRHEMDGGLGDFPSKVRRAEVRCSARRKHGGRDCA